MTGFAEVCKKGMPCHAEWMFKSPEEIESVLRGDRLPEWEFEDEIEQRVEKHLKDKENEQ